MDAQAKPERPQGEGQEGPSSSLPLRHRRSVKMGVIPEVLTISLGEKCRRNNNLLVSALWVRSSRCVMRVVVRDELQNQSPSSPSQRYDTLHKEGVQSLPISAGSSTPSGRSRNALRSCGRRPGLVGLVISSMTAPAERITPTLSNPRRSPTVDKRCMLGGFWNTRSPRSSCNTSKGSFDSKYRRTPPSSLMKSIIASSPMLRLRGFPAWRRSRSWVPI